MEVVASQTPSMIQTVVITYARTQDAVTTRQDDIQRLKKIYTILGLVHFVCFCVIWAVIDDGNVILQLLAFAMRSQHLDHLFDGLVRSLVFTFIGDVTLTILCARQTPNDGAFACLCLALVLAICQWGTLLKRWGLLLRPTGVAEGDCHWSTVESPSSTRCSICLDNFSAEQAVAIQGCGHEFHASCLRTWLKVNPTCPLCRCVPTIV